MLGPRWVELIHPDERERAYRIWTDSFAERIGFSLENHFRRVDGPTRSIAS